MWTSVFFDSGLDALKAGAVDWERDDIWAALLCDSPSKNERVLSDIGSSVVNITKLTGRSVVYNSGRAICDLIEFPNMTQDAYAASVAVFSKMKAPSKLEGMLLCLVTHTALPMKLYTGQPVSIDLTPTGVFIMP